MLKKLRYLIYFFLFNLVMVHSVWSQEKNKLEIKVSGIDGEMAENIQVRLAHDRKEINLESASSKSTNYLKQVPQIIQKALSPFGYFNVKVTPMGVAYEKTKKVALFRVKLGSPIRIYSVNIQLSGPGKYNHSLIDFVNKLPITRGDIFNSNEYENARDFLLQAAVNTGYINASYSKKEVLINRERYQADITLILQTGEQYYFGALSYPPSPFSQSFLNRFQSSNTSSYFSSKKLYQFQQEMSRSGYFQQVDVTPDFDHIVDKHVPIRVAVMAPKSQRYDMGLGYGTFTGPRLSAGVNLRRVTDDGQHFEAKLNLSSVISGLTAKYYIPGSNPLTDQYVIGTGYQKFKPKNGSSYSNNISAGYNVNYLKWRNSFTLTYLTERYNVVSQATTHSEILYPGLNVTYMNVDDIINPSIGKSISFILQGATNNLLSSTSFLQGEVKGKYLFSPTKNSRLLFRSDVGYTIVNNIDDLPLTLRYFAGGLNSIRGYPDSSIGPGKYLVVGSAEYQHKVWGDFYGALFCDMGMVGDHYGDPPFSIGDGIGVIYKSVVGPIRLYLARAENKRGKPRSIEFSVGPEF